MVGRAGAGILATFERVNILHLNNLTLMGAGVSTALVVVLCHNYASLVVYSIIFGLCVGENLCF